MQPKYCYGVAATLSDETENTSVIIFDQAITSIIGIMLTWLFSMDTLSAWIHRSKHHSRIATGNQRPKKIYHLERSTGTSAFKINRAFNIQDATSTPSTIIQTPNQTTPTPATPAAEPKSTTAKRQLFQIPGKHVEESKRQIQPPD